MNNRTQSNRQQVNKLKSNTIKKCPIYSNLKQSKFKIDKLGVSLNVIHDDRALLEERIESYKTEHKASIKECRRIGGYKNTIVIRIDNGKKKKPYYQPPILRFACDPYYSNCAYISLEFNPASLTKFGKKQLVKVLRKILGKKHFNKLYSEGMITRLDIAMDLFGLKLQDLFFYQSHSQSSQKFMTLLQHDGQALRDNRIRYYYKKSLESIYIGDQYSDFYICVYDKNIQIIADSAKKGHVKLQPRDEPWVRYEARFKNIKLSMKKLNTFKPNLRNIMILTYPEIISVLDNNAFHDIRPFFLYSCAINGLHESIKEIHDDNMRRKFKSLLKVRGQFTINMQTDLDLVWRKLSRSKLRFMKPQDK